MKRTILVSTFILLCLASIHGQHSQAAIADNPESGTWINVAPANAGFTILMPAQPREGANPLKDGLDQHFITLETKLAAYVVSYIDFPEAVTDPAAIKDMLDRGRDGAVATMKAELTSEREIKIKQFVGREWLMKLPKGLIATARTYWVRHRLYQTVFVTTPAADDSSEVMKLRQEVANRFLNSFSLSGDNVAK
ncbi:MAG TPA: hypothetical protein VMZ30_10770 [Pyrinomonadaceae bacterium]|nr:hypothetical protein [Pyrinomonadaceae bacterium]